MLVVCNQHAGIDLTSKVDKKLLSSEAKTIIAQVKIYEKDRSQKQILDKISLSLSSHCQDKRNQTIIGLNEDSGTVLKAEILLLKQLNVEMQDKNNILKELVNRMNSEINDLKTDDKLNKITYANLTKTEKMHVKHIPPLIVKSKLDKNKGKTHKTVVNKITNEIMVPVDKINETKNEEVIIKCNSSNDIETIETELRKKIGSDYDIYQEE